MRALALLIALVLLLRSLHAALADEGPLKSSTSFLSEALKAEQHDETANPGMLWVSEGEELWKKADGAAGKSCGSCHGDAKASMKGVAAHYPMVDPGTGKLLNLELRINQCRSDRQKAETFPYESEELLALTAFVSRQSFGIPMQVKIDERSAPFYEKGKSLFYLRQGQINLSCAQCHEDNVGRHLRGDIISSAVGTGYPVYRLEW